MSTERHPIHHVTAIASDPQRNIDFYTGLLGLRLVKLTVNFDDPGAYHLYYGDGVGNPGTILTFFAWPGAPRGQRGSAQVAVTTLGILPSALDFWRGRLADFNVDYEDIAERFEHRVFVFQDPDGMTLELETDPSLERVGGWSGGPIPSEHSIRGVHSITLWLNDAAPSGILLTDILGFREEAQRGDITRYSAGEGIPGTVIQLRDGIDQPGTIAVGSVHHVAYQVANDQEQLTMREQLAESGYSVTPVRDRTYFRSIYFVEPGGVLFEVATNPPGFTVDEPESELGTHLKLPGWLESRRALVERSLPALSIGTGNVESRT